MIKNKALALALAGLGLTAPLAHAEEAASPVAGNLTFVSNYVVRGLSQTNFKPAVQGTVEYSHSSGVYAGLFGSNVSWMGDAWQAPGAGGDAVDPVLGFSPYGSNSKISGSFELDLYAGVRNKFMGDFSYDVGAVYYYYPGTYNLDTSAATGAPGLKKPDTAEVYAGLGWKWFTAKLWYAVSDGVFMVSDARGTTYANLQGTFPIGDSGYTLIGAAGSWMFKGEMENYKNYGVKNDVLDLVDYKIGVTKDFFGFTFGAFYWGSTADKTFKTKENTANNAVGSEVAAWGNRFGKNVGDDTFILQVTKSF